MPPVFRRSALLLLSLLLSCQGGAEEETITSTAAVRALDREVAARGIPAEIRGIVTYAYGDPNLGNFILEQDGTSIFVNVIADKMTIIPDPAHAGAPAPRVTYGTEVILRGKTWRGQYAPVVVAEELRVLGGKALPPAGSFDLAKVLTGSMDCQRLDVRCVVQGAEVATGPSPLLRLEIAVPTGRMLAECTPPGKWTREELIGATIRMSAVCLTYFNVRGEVLGIHFVLANPDDIVVEKPAPPDPFAVPKVPLTGLQPFSRNGPNLERVQITGQVTLSRPGEFFYLEDAGRAVRVFTKSPVRYTPGDCVIASGFIDLHQSFADLRDAEVRLTERGTLPPPPQVSYRALIDASERRWGAPLPVDFNGRVISFQGTLTKTETAEDGSRRLLLTTDGGLVSASLDAGGGAAALDKIAPGSEVNVTGICEMQFPSTQLLTDFPNPTGFSVLLRSQEDLRVLREAPWWTPKRLWLLLGSTAGLLGLAVGSNILLRRIVKQRSSQLAAETRARDRAEIEFDATLRERTRLAADLHDTLEQALTGLAFQLDTSRVLATKAPDTSARHLELGRQLLTRSREDLRRSLWNLRSQGLDDHSFAEAIRSAAFQAAEGRPITITVEEQGDPCPLPEFIAGNLLLLAQEAMTNAIKHGKPETIAILVDYRDGCLELSVRDDGGGFDPKQAPGLHEGHFGLQGMRERANRLDGEVWIESHPGRGTKVTVKVPLPAENRAAAAR